MSMLPDVNVLVYAVDRSSLNHAHCHQWLSAALNGTDTVFFWWHCIVGFVRVTTNPRAMAKPLTLDEAFDYVEEWLALPSSQILQPRDSDLSVFRQFAKAAGIGGNLTTDAHLAALATAHGLELCSCDSDFKKFPGLRWTNPVTNVSVTNP